MAKRLALWRLDVQLLCHSIHKPLSVRKEKSMKKGHDNFFCFQKIKTVIEVMLTPHKDTLNTPARHVATNYNKVRWIHRGKIIPDSKVHGANMGPIWGQQKPGRPHVGPMNFFIWDRSQTIKYVTIVWLPRGFLGNTAMSCRTEIRFFFI